MNVKIKIIIGVLTRFITVLGTMWLFEELLDHFSIKFLKGNFLAFISIVLNIWILIEILYYYLKMRKRETSLSFKLIQELESLYANGDYESILRHRQNFSRILWIEGKAKERIRLGEIAEDAAVKIGDKIAQVSILIDDLGWSLVSQKEFESAIRYLKHGLKIATEINEYYWIAKAHRHLAGINIEAERIADAIKELELAENAALQIKTDPLKTEMLAGIYYGISVANLKNESLDLALEYLNKSENLRAIGNDRTRIVKIYSLKGKIYEAKEDYDSAKDYYRQGLTEAKRIGRIDEVIRNHMGLARVFEIQGDKKNSQFHLNEAKNLSESTPVPFEINEKEFKIKLSNL